MRFTHDDRVDQIRARRNVAFGCVKDHPAAIRAAGCDHERVVARKFRVALRKLIESEPDRFQKVFAPVLLRILFRVRGLKSDAVRPFGEKLGACSVVRVGTEMRGAAGFGRRNLPPIEKID